MKQLVKFRCDCQDEFDVFGFAVLEQEQAEKLFLTAELFLDLFPEEEFIINVGTNEKVSFDDYKSYRNSFECINLTDDEAKTFEEYFCTNIEPYPNFGLTEPFDLESYQENITETFLETYCEYNNDLVDPNELSLCLQKLQAAKAQGLVTQEMLDTIQEELDKEFNYPT